MTREDIINQVLRNTSIEESEDYMEDYPYSRPSGQMSGWNVPLASTVGGVAAQSFGGHGIGGGFPFLPIGTGTGTQPYDESYAEEFAAENAMENAAYNAAEQANAQQLANANANAARNAQELSTELKRAFAYDQPLEKPQIQSDTQIFARGENAIEEMREKGRLLRGEQLTKEQMETAQEATQMQFGRFADTAIEQQVRERNPQANEMEIKAKAEEIKEKVRNSAETVEESDFEITYKDFSTPQVEGIRDKTQVASTGRDFSDVNRIKNTERTINGTSTVGYNKPVADSRNVFQKGFDYMTKTAQESAENPLIGLGAYALAAPAIGSIGTALSAAVAPVASNVLQFPTAAKVASAAGTVGGTVLNFPKSAAAETSIKSQSSYQPVLWNPSTQKVDAVSSAAPKVTTTPTIKTAAEKVASALKNITAPKTTSTTTQKLSTKEKRLGKL